MKMKNYLSVIVDHENFGQVWVSVSHREILRLNQSFLSDPDSKFEVRRVGGAGFTEQDSLDLFGSDNGSRFFRIVKK